MKKLICGLICLSSLVCASFSKNFLSKRFFELQLSVPVDFSNNVFSLNDILKKEVVLDLGKIAEDPLLNNGLNLVMQTQPQYGINLNIAAVNVGFKVGVDIYEKMNVSKDLFTLLGKGNEIGEEIDIDFKNYTDIFITSSLNVGINFGKFSVSVKPTLFVPAVSVVGSVADVSFINTEDGSINAKISSDLSLFSNFQLNNLNEMDIQRIYSGIGFDFGGSASIPLGRKLTVSADARIPIVPGSYSYRTPMTFETGISANISQSISDTTGESEMITQTGDDLGNISNMFSDLQSYELEEKKYVNRPLKAKAYATYTPILGLVEFCGGAGFGIYHPFNDDAFFYPEYYLSAGINCFDFFKAKLSTEYTDQIFKHQAAVDVNVRLVEIECGVSFQSTDFLKSMNVTGIGAYVVTSIGF